MKIKRDLVAVGALHTGLGVAFGAFAAHALRDRIAPDLLEIFKTGVLYQQIHGLALLGTAAAAEILGERKTVVVGALFQIGIFIFSGSLYALALTGTRWLGAITPLGGVAFLGAWLTMFLAALKKSEA
ncbi:MAG: DUF423 domain-containing protein [Fimbriimonadales bacterium]